jgi:hypothetical protein
MPSAQAVVPPKNTAVPLNRIPLKAESYKAGDAEIVKRSHKSLKLLKTCAPDRNRRGPENGNGSQKSFTGHFRIVGQFRTTAAPNVLLWRFRLLVPHFGKPCTRNANNGKSRHDGIPNCGTSRHDVKIRRGSKNIYPRDTLGFCVNHGM